jgi:hypothetical protein
VDSEEGKSMKVGEVVYAIVDTQENTILGDGECFCISSGNFWDDVDLERAANVSGIARDRVGIKAILLTDLSRATAECP